jgi:hypothetical protein
MQDETPRSVGKVKLAVVIVVGCATPNQLKKPAITDPKSRHKRKRKNSACQNLFVAACR